MPDATHDLVRRLYAAIDAGDLDTVRGLLAPDAIWHVPGDGPLSGDHGDAVAAAHLFARLYDLTDGAFRVAPAAIIAEGDRAVALLDVRAQVAGAAYGDRGVHVLRIAGGRVAEAWAYAWDQPALDRLLDLELARRA